MEKDDLIQELRRRQDGQSLRQFSQTVGCSTAYLSDVYHGKRDLGPKILDYLGVEKKTEVKTTYRWR